MVPEWERVRWGKQLGRRGVGVGREREWALAPRQLEGEGKKRVRGCGKILYYIYILLTKWFTITLW